MGTSVLCGSQTAHPTELQYCCSFAIASWKVTILVGTPSVAVSGRMDCKLASAVSFSDGSEAEVRRGISRSLLRGAATPWRHCRRTDGSETPSKALPGRRAEVQRMSELYDTIDDHGRNL